MRERNLIRASKVLSAIFNPFYLAVVGLIILFLFSYMALLPWAYKLWVVTLVYILTVMLPTLLIRWYRSYQGWSLFELGLKERRMVPYLISIVCYALCFYLMNFMHIPHFMSSIIVAAWAIQVVCALVNLQWKICNHTAAIGGVGGALLAFSLMFSFNPNWWFCLILLLAGFVGTARMVLRQHSLSEVVVGFLVGTAIAFLVILRI